MMSNIDGVERVHPVYPIFRMLSQPWSIFYVAGRLAVVEQKDADLIRKFWTSDDLQQIKEPELHHVATWLTVHGAEALENRRHFFNAPFIPECLMVYLSRFCNLKCDYCFVTDKPVQGLLKLKQAEIRKLRVPVIDMLSFESAAMVVAKNCARKNSPFHLVLHGGGEPTLHWDLVKKFEKASRRIASQFGIGWFGYIATNGVISRKKARWLALHFNRIGLSCDGPPDIQNQQRPLISGKKTSPFIERTASIISDTGGKFEIRATITPQTVTRQEEIISYFCHVLKATSVRFEPVYAVYGHKKNTDAFLPEHAELFCKHFLDAQKAALSSGCRLSLSGIRLDEIHGPHCNVLKNVLHLTPDGTASSCFFCTNTQWSGHEFFNIGHRDQLSGLFFLDNEKIALHAKNVETMHQECKNCINIMHCAGQCPDQCRANPDLCNHWNPQKDFDKPNSFRCMVYRKLTSAWILEAARKLVPSQQHNDKILSTKKSSIDHESFLHNLNHLPPGVDRIQIRNQWNSVDGIYPIGSRQMPSPIWQQRGFEQKGEEAWQHLRKLIPRIPVQNSISLYIHVPFCEYRCAFCDCYSIPIGKNSEWRQTKFARALIAEISIWSRIPGLNKRNVTTIHFGGGTPNCLYSHILEDIISRLRINFQITRETEWALESTGRLTNDNHLVKLKQWGFTRLHVGVQTLSDPLRVKIGRKSSRKQIMQKLTNAMKMGFITSVDVLYGLPGQTMDDLVFTLEQLIFHEIHGISLYRFNISRRNRWFVKAFENFCVNDFYDYLLLQIGEQLLERAGYRKNHFNHFAKPEDGNLYFTYPQRSEDLLAMGPTADGIFDDYHYRHPGFAAYCSKINPYFPALQGGIEPTPVETELKPFITAVMSGKLQEHMLQRYSSSLTEPLIEKWLTGALIKSSLDFKGFELTANGSWFLSNMIADVKNSLRQI